MRHTSSSQEIGFPTLESQDCSWSSVSKPRSSMFQLWCTQSYFVFSFLCRAQTSFSSFSQFISCPVI